MLQSAYNSNALTIANEVQLSQLIGAGMIIAIGETGSGIQN